MDSLRLATIIGGIALVFVVAAAAFVGWQNRGGQSVVFATATLAGAIIFYVMQLTFELRGNSDMQLLTAEVTIDRTRATAYLPDYTNVVHRFRLHAKQAVEALAATNAVVLKDQSEALSSDFVLFALISYIAEDQSDWQLHERTLRGKRYTVGTKQRVSNTSDSTSVSLDSIKAQLASSGNLLAGHFRSHGPEMRLPLGSKLSIERRSIRVVTSVCDISFEIEPSGAVDFIDPTTNAVSQRVDGHPQFENRLIGVRIKTQFRALRAKSPSRQKYEDWFKRLIAGSRECLES
jgi:hypothetical protein